ncbi:putative NBD/HSP70 family sugar kinase [Labrenzia sp. EL_13]|nr:putative NBD/HSP70 family sugar kinase [Labrenzia sp. EL_195]MBG6202096.1 putative NBD/HSP70 family sugar kinase [Labrenzia sp. EL_13]
MSLLLQHDGMTRLQLGQESGLSAQTISVIVRALERDNLVSKGEAVRGRIGPPTTPISLNPDGAFSIGIHVDRHAIEATIINFVGAPVAQMRSALTTFDVQNVRDALIGMVDKLLGTLRGAQKTLVAGIGLTFPKRFEVEEEQAVLAYDFEQDLRAHSGLEVVIQDDVTAAASAETLYGQAKRMDDLLFCYASKDLKPRLILGGRIYTGSSPQIPICDSQTWHQTTRNFESFATQDDPGVQRWIQQVTSKVADLVQDLGTFASVPEMILSAPVPKTVIDELVSRIRSKVSMDLSVTGSRFGPNALAIGAAIMPIQTRFTANTL